MAFPAYVRSIIDNDDDEAWPFQAQGRNECGCTVAANAGNLIVGKRIFLKDDFVRRAGLFFQPNWGGTPSPTTGWLLRLQGFGTHFGCLKNTDADTVLRDLIDRRCPVALEIGTNLVAGIPIYGQHAILLVGYGVEEDGTTKEYYFADSEWPVSGFNARANQLVLSNQEQRMPGNRTISRADFQKLYTTGIYFPVFRTQAEHDAWYATNIQRRRGIPVVQWLLDRFIIGSQDIWVGPRPSYRPQS